MVDGHAVYNKGTNEILTYFSIIFADNARFDYFDIEHYLLIQSKETRQQVTHINIFDKIKPEKTALD